MSKQPTKQAKTEDFEITQFILKPMEQKKINLGSYRIGQAPPRFITTWNPKDAPHVVSFRDCPIRQGDGIYILYRQFQNFDDARLCSVQIQRTHKPGSGQPAQIDEL